MTDLRTRARALALGRIAIGAALMIAPRMVGSVWLGQATARGDGVHVALRALGARDLALGFGLKAALDRDAPTRGWLEAGLLADGADLAATLAAGDELPLPGRALIGVMAGSACGLGATLVRSIEAGPASPPPEQTPERVGAAALSSARQPA